MSKALDLGGFNSTYSHLVKTELIAFKKSIFSGGEVNISISQNDYQGDEVSIYARLNNSEDIMTLLLAVNALRREFFYEIKLFLPYMPYARQDRIMQPGQALSVKVMADIINYCKFNEVIVYDAHSDVTAALIDNFNGVTNIGLVEQVLEGKEDYWIVSPDAGAAKKIYSVAREVGYDHNIVVCGKHRNVKTGEITGTSVDHDDLNGLDCYLIDDICDGGRTFIEIAKVLKRRNCGKLFLVVSHGIFSNGFDELFYYFDHIYCTNSIKDIVMKDLISEKKFTQFHILNIL